MPRRKQDILSELTLADLKKLTAAKEKIVKLEARRDELSSALSKVETELAKVLDGAGKKLGKTTKTKKRGKKVARRKKATRKKVVKKKATKKVAKKRVVKKKVTKKKVARKKVAKVAARKASGRVTLEDVIVKLIGSKGKGASISFQDLLMTIQKKKLYQTKSSNFANVLRRTLSTSKRVKRVSRGVYGVA